ncbi:MAG TPA: S41 family peptidase [Candidatus Krumholzibacterium sp.]|nr:S41 family peptidase [Candidatus Krumholzibacterium sp.]
MKFILLIIIPIAVLFPVFAAPRAAGSELSREETRGLVEDVCRLLAEHYVYPDIAHQISDTLRSRLETDYYRAAGLDELSDLISRDLKAVNGDLHLNAWFIPPSQRSSGGGEHPDLVEMQLNIIKSNAERSFDFKKVEILPGNIGYFELTKFKSIPDPKLERMLSGVMDVLSCSSAIILDLRRNTGGNSRMIERFMSYFFERRTELTGQYTRPSGGIMRSWTTEGVGGGHLARLPLYVLVSSRTISGPEQVAYDLQVLGRAVIVGEKTKGAANPSRFHRIQEKLLVCIPYGYAVNPVTSSSWEGTGVTPDVPVPADSALAVALRLAGEAAERFQAREQARVDSLVAGLKSRVEQFEVLVGPDPARAGELLDATLEEYFAIEYINQYLMLDWIDSYVEAGSTLAAEMIALRGIDRFPAEDRFYSKLADLYYGEERFGEALDVYERLLELDPGYEVARKRIEDIRKDAGRVN